MKRGGRDQLSVCVVAKIVTARRLIVIYANSDIREYFHIPISVSSNLMAEFVQNYHIQKFLSLSNDQECNIFDRKLFGLTEIRNPRTQVGAIDEHRNKMS